MQLYKELLLHCSFFLSPNLLPKKGVHIKYTIYGLNKPRRLWTAIVINYA